MKNPFPAPALTASILLAALCASPAPLDAADTVLLRSGELFTGKVLRLNNEEVSIQLDSGGILTFRCNRVYRVRRWIANSNTPQVTTFKDGEEVEPKATPSEGSEAESRSPATGQGDEGGDVLEGQEPWLRAPQPPFRFSGASPVVLPSTDLQRGWSLRPPPGFEEWSPGENFTEVIRAWRDRSGQSTITLVAHRFGDSPEKLKKAIGDKLQAAPRFRAIRDQPFQKGGAGGYRGWLCELERQHTGILLRQILLLAERDDSIYLLCFTTPHSEYPLLARPFEDCLESLEVLKSATESPADPASDPSSASPVDPASDPSSASPVDPAFPPAPGPSAPAEKSAAGDPGGR